MKPKTKWCQLCAGAEKDHKWPWGQLAFGGKFHRMRYAWGKTVCGRNIPTTAPWARGVA